MTPADARQLRHMLAVVSAVRNGSASLVEGADSLLFLRDALEQVDESWADEFTAHVATLESAGTATASQIESMGSDYRAVVANALTAIEEAVRRRAPDGLVDEDS